MTLIQALLREHRKPEQDVKGKVQAEHVCEAITNACSGGGWNRSSNETAVMEVERRVPIMQFII